MVAKAVSHPCADVDGCAGKIPALLRSPPIDRPRAVILAAALRALERVSAEERTSGAIADCGTSETAAAEIGRLSTDEVSVEEVAVMLDVSERRARQLAAGPLMGRKVGARWLVDRANVEAELERRGAA